MGKNQMYGYFKQQTGEIVHEKTWAWLRYGKIKRETETLLITAQNNAIRINYVKIKIDNTQQNSKCWLSGETIHHINECSKLGI